MQVQENFSLQKLNTFGLDISTRWYVRVQSVEELQIILNDPKFISEKKLILGGGSNVLFTGNYDGLVIHNCIEKIETVSEDENSVTLTAGAGMNWHQFVLYTINKNYQGLENLSLIPGCVGAAPIQNIGAYGVEIKNTFQQLRAVKLEDCSMHEFDAEACRFGYRDSFFKHEGKNKFAIIDVSFRLNKNGILNLSYGAIEEQLKSMGITHPKIKDVSDAVISIRSSKLPDPKMIGNAGSFFKNPEIDIELYKKLTSKFPGLVSYPSGEKMKLAAGWLIEQSGWKGKRIGNVGMHEKQALVLVNHGGATGKELIAHAERVSDSVYEKFGVMLEKEVNIVQ